MSITLIDLKPYYGILKVSGPDAATFLQGQLTCDVRNISDKALKLGGHCNTKGRLRALFRIFKQAEDFYLQTPLLQIEFAMGELKKYAKFSKVTISDESASKQILGFIGIENPEHFLKTYSLADKPNIHLIKIPHSENRYEFIAPEDFDLHSSSNISTLNQISQKDFECWKLADIRDGLPEIWPELREQILPHHINLPQLGGVSFNKGCYCGQEIIARMEYRGNIKKSMVQMRLPNAETIIPGTLLSDIPNNHSTDNGLVVSAALTSEPEDHTEMLVISSSSLLTV